MIGEAFSHFRIISRLGAGGMGEVYLAEDIRLGELFTGKPAFRGNSNIDTLHAIIHNEPVSATELNPRLPPEAAEVLDKALAKHPAERYHHAGDLELDLRRLKRALDTIKSGRRMGPL